MEEKQRFECPNLPKGWMREIVMRKSGLSAGRSDVYYYRYKAFLKILKSLRFFFFIQVKLF